MKYDNPQLFLLIIFILPLLLLYLLDRINRAQIFKWYTVAKNIKIINYTYRVFYLILISLSLIFMIVALALPYTDKKEKRKEKIQGEEILFLVDVSRSMLGEDVVPSRLEKVKLEIIDFASRHKGYKMGLIAFAGDAVIKSPMTTDNFFFISAVKSLSTSSVSRGSTSLATALYKSIKLLPNSDTDASARNIIIFTDGEDHEDDPIKAAKKVEAQGGRLLIIAVGDNKIGARIPIIADDGSKSYLTYKGQEVWSKTNLTVLKRITESVRSCALVPALVGNYNLNNHYDSFVSKMGISTVVETTADVEVEIQYNHLPFIILSLVFIFLSILIIEISRWRLKFD